MRAGPGWFFVGMALAGCGHARTPSPSPALRGFVQRVVGRWVRKDDPNTILEVGPDGTAFLTLTFGGPESGLAPATSHGRLVGSGAFATARMEIDAPVRQDQAESGPSGDYGPEAQRQEHRKRLSQPSMVRFSLDEGNGELILEGFLDQPTRFTRQ